MSYRDFWKSLEISDYTDYETITQMGNALKIKKICLILFLKSV
jgi:hypothetical protein